VSASVGANVWHNDDKANALHVKLAVKFAPDLAKDVKGATNNYRASIELENERKLAKYGGDPAQPQQPTAPPPAQPPADGGQQPAGTTPATY
jgi:hypothetical protein